MAGEISITAANVLPVEIIEKDTRPASVAINAGQLVRNDANGRWAIANATDAANAGQRVAMAINTASQYEAITAVFKGVINIGGTGLDAVANDAPLYLSDTAGAIATSAGTVSKLVATVTSVKSSTAQQDKLVRMNG